jgi:hypothetical protein
VTVESQAPSDVLVERVMYFRRNGVATGGTAAFGELTVVVSGSGKGHGGDSDAPRGGPPWAHH